MSRNMPEGESVSLEEMLDAREKRAWRQKDLLEQYGVPLICFTLNVPGPIKRFPLAECTFREGKERILCRLKNIGAQVLHCEQKTDKCGCEGFFCVDAPPREIKGWMLSLEEQGPLSRLYDIDVLDVDGNKISRGELGLPGRTCMLCGKPAGECARSRAHSLEELQGYVMETMKSHFSTQFADRIAEYASRSLLYELLVTPKPGLVDRQDNGAHADMDTFTFADSIARLTPYFREIVLEAVSFQGAKQDLLKKLRLLGEWHEEQMMAATGGVNTHKGAVFSLGLLCACAGILYKEGKFLTTEDICVSCKAFAGDIVKTDFSRKDSVSGKTRGEALYARYKITGARGEAASGFASVRRWGLPVLKDCLGRGFSINDAGVGALLSLIANVQDSNVVARGGGPQALEWVSSVLGGNESYKADAKAAITLAEKLNKEFIRRNISPGGCADLLAATFFLYFLEADLQ